MCAALQTADACGSPSYLYASVFAAELNFNVPSHDVQKLREEKDRNVFLFKFPITSL
jgi:hypothetical protein